MENVEKTVLENNNAICKNDYSTFEMRTLLLKMMTLLFKMTTLHLEMIMLFLKMIIYRGCF